MCSQVQLPQPIEDTDLAHIVNEAHVEKRRIATSIHFFKLAKLNSEIKYVANSIKRDAPAYAYPAMRDVTEWQMGMLHKLDDWAATIPQMEPPSEFMRLTSKLRYLSMKMLLLRPSPAIPVPAGAAMISCYEAACQSLRTYEDLYRRDLIVYDWLTLHGVVYSVITALYCIRVVPEIARKTEPEETMEDLSVSLSILSATGEHWSGAKRARDILEDIGKSTIRWLRKNRGTSYQGPSIDRETSDRQHQRADTEGNVPVAQSARQEQKDIASAPTPSFDFFSAFELDCDLFPELQQSRGLFGDSVNVDDMMRNLFDDFIPSN